MGKKKQKKFMETAVAASKKRNRKPGRGNEISKEITDAAFELFCDGVAIKQMGRKFNVSPQTLYKYRDKLKWQERKDKRFRQAANQADNVWTKTKSRHITLSQSLQAKGYKRVKNIPSKQLTAKEARMFIVDGVKLEREILGQAGDGDRTINIAVIFPAELSGL